MVIKKILFVDNDASYRKSVISMLSDKFEFIQAETVTDALDLLNKNPDVRVMILDLQLGKHNGTTLLEAISERIEDYRVIILSSHEELLAAEEAAAYKVFSYLSKTQGLFRETLLFQISNAFTDLERAPRPFKSAAHRRAEEKIALALNEGAQDLNLSGEGEETLIELPESIMQLTQLHSLNLSNNQLSELPDWLGNLTELQKLNVAGNQLTTLPESLARLTQLEELNLSDNWFE